MKEQLIAAIKVRPLLIRACSLCGYDMKYSYQGGQFGFDTGCWCTDMSGGWAPRSEDELDFYCEPSHGWIEAMKTFIGAVNVGQTIGVHSDPATPNQG